MGALCAAACYANTALFWTSVSYGEPLPHTQVTLRKAGPPAKKSSRHCKSGQLEQICTILLELEVSPEPKFVPMYLPFTAQNSLFIVYRKITLDSLGIKKQTEQSKWGDIYTLAIPVLKLLIILNCSSASKKVFLPRLHCFLEELSQMGKKMPSSPQNKQTFK